MNRASIDSQYEAPYAVYSHRVQYLSAFALSFGYMTVGCHMGWPSPVLLQVFKQNTTESPDDATEGNATEPPGDTAEQNPRGPLANATITQGDWVISMMYIGEFVFTPVAGTLSNHWGRKWLIVMSVAPGVASWILLALARTLLHIYIGRFVAGISLALIMTVGPIYLTEIASDEIRGKLATSFLVMMNLGIVMEYVVGPKLSFEALAVFSTVPLVVFVMTFTLAPEAPSFLITMGNRMQAGRSLMTLRGTQNPQDVQQELTDMEKSVEEDPQTLRGILRQGSMQKVAFIAGGLVLLRAFSGLEAIISHCSEILQVEHIGQLGSIEVALSELFTCFVVPFVVDKYGRRPLLIVSALFSAACLVGMAITHLSIDADTEYLRKWVFLPLLIGYVIAQTAGWSSLIMAYIAEISGPRWRANIMMYSYMLLSASWAAIDMIYPEMVIRHGEAAIVILTASSCLLAAIFVAVFIPETSQRSLRKIQRHIAKNPLFSSSCWPRKRAVPDPVPVPAPAPVPDPNPVPARVPDPNNAMDKSS